MGGLFSTETKKHSLPHPTFDFRPRGEHTVDVLKTCSMDFQLKFKDNDFVFEPSTRPLASIIKAWGAIESGEQGDKWIFLNKIKQISCVNRTNFNVDVDFWIYMFDTDPTKISPERTRIPVGNDPYLATTTIYKHKFGRGISLYAYIAYKQEILDPDLEVVDEKLSVRFVRTNSAFYKVYWDSYGTFKSHASSTLDVSVFPVVSDGILDSTRVQMNIECINAFIIFIKDTIYSNLTLVDPFKCYVSIQNGQNGWDLKDVEKFNKNVREIYGVSPPDNPVLSVSINFEVEYIVINKHIDSNRNVDVMSAFRSIDPSTIKMDIFEKTMKNVKPNPTVNSHIQKTPHTSVVGNERLKRIEDITTNVAKTSSIKVNKSSDPPLKRGSLDLNEETLSKQDTLSSQGTLNNQESANKHDSLPTVTQGVEDTVTSKVQLVVLEDQEK